MTEARLAQLMAIRNIVDAMIAEEAGDLEPESVPEVPVDSGDCKHENKQNVAGAGMASEAVVCVDCGKEF